MQYIVISRTGEVIIQSSSLFLLSKSIKDYLIKNRLKESDLYYYTPKELQDFIKKEGSDKFINVRKILKGKNRFVALSKNRGERLFISDSEAELTMRIIEYLNNRKLLKNIDYITVENHIKSTKNIVNIEIIKFNKYSKDAEKFGDLNGLSNRKINANAHFINGLIKEI